jgi:hypothetical protein
MYNSVLWEVIKPIENLSADMAGHGGGLASEFHFLTYLYFERYLGMHRNRAIKVNYIFKISPVQRKSR